MQLAKRKMQNEASPWPHRWAVALAYATFPLLWIGGLVTSTKAGMAVPDWPNTYGYNLFLYPLSTWWAGPWDIFVEHGHRLFASVVGVLTICLLVALRRNEDRIWVRRLGLMALGLVVFQGVLGGMRVLLDERSLAMIHGFTGPAFFGLVVALAVVTSVTWRRVQIDDGADVRKSPVMNPHAANVHRLAVFVAVLAYLQIVLGAVLRHMPVAAQPATFVQALRSHLVMAGVLTLGVSVLVWSVARNARNVKPLGGLAAVLGLLLTVQLVLGASTWIVKYSVPTWARAWLPESWTNAAIVDGGPLQMHVVTGHVAIGSLLMATSLALALYALRLLHRPVDEAASVRRWEAAV